MTHVDPSQAWGISAGVSPRAIVALKNGWLPVDAGWQVNSVGLVHGGGRNYAIAVLVDGASTQAAGIQTIEGLSRLVWRELAQRTTAYRAGGCPRSRVAAGSGSPHIPNE